MFQKTMKNLNLRENMEILLFIFCWMQVAICENYTGWPISYFSVLGQRFVLDWWNWCGERTAERQFKCMPWHWCCFIQLLCQELFPQRVSNVMTLPCFFQVICNFFLYLLRRVSIHVSAILMVSLPQHLCGLGLASVGHESVW